MNFPPLALSLLCLPLLALPIWAQAQAASAAAAALAPAASPEDAALAQAPTDERPAPRAQRATSPRAFKPVLRAGVDDVLIESGAFSRAPEADRATAVRLSPYALWQPQRAWELRAGARLEGASQSGGAAGYTQWRGDVADTYARYRDGNTRLTAGAQTVVWGRVDDISTLDRVSRVDLTRFALDNLAERRRPQLALRWEQTLGDYKLDSVLLPAAFRGARLPDARSVWSPINRLTGEIIGIAPSPALAALARNSRVLQDDGGAGGGALRLTRTGVAPFDFGLTLARTRQSLPYFQADAVARTLTAVHPYNSFAGVDVEFATGSVTWRSEFGITDGQRVTVPTGGATRSRALDWIGGVEFFPGGKDTRVSLQVAARSLRTAQTVLELKDYASVNGEIETQLDQGRWRLGLRFFSGLNVRDVYLAPKVSYLGWEPHEVYLTGRYFDGETRTLGGFHRDHRNVAVGLKSKF